MYMFKFVASSLFGAPAVWVTISTYVPNHHYCCRTRTKHASPDIIPLCFSWASKFYELRTMLSLLSLFSCTVVFPTV